MTGKKHVVYRILDANANRAVEGLRVVEDFVRFGMDAQGLSRELKTLRHALVREIYVLPASIDMLLLSRDAVRDVGIKSGVIAVKSLNETLTSNLKRVQESLRVIEEASKAIQPRSSVVFERIRFRVYALEKDILARFHKTFREKKKIKGVYFVADMESAGKSRFHSVVRQALKAGVDVIQLRWKEINLSEAVSTGKWMKGEAKKYGVPFLVNDRVDAALWLDADGVHLGQKDMPLSTARKILGPDKIIGISSHNPVEAEKAQYGGADYVAVGPVFPTQTKKDTHPVVGVKGVRRVKETVSIPVVAIGGINESNVREVAAKGKANAAAVISAITKSKNISLTVRKLKQFFVILFFLAFHGFSLMASDFSSELQKARALSAQERLGEAAAAYQNLLPSAASASDLQIISLEYASVLDRLGRVTDEAGILKNAFEADKTTVQASTLCSMLGSLYFKLGSLNDARASLAECVKLFPSHPSGFNMKLILSQIAEREGDVDESAAILKQILKGSKHDGEYEYIAVRYALLDFYMRTKNYAEAVKLLEEEIKSKPDDFSLLSQLGDLYEKLEKFEDALSLVEKMEKVSPDAAFQRKVLILKKLNRLGEEEKKLKISLSKQKTVTLYLRLVQVFEAEGKFTESVELLEKARAAFPSDENVAVKLAQVYQQSKQYDKALLIYHDLLKKVPQNYWYYRNIGEIYALSGKKADAVEAWKKSFLYNSKDANSVLNFASFLHEESFDEDAITAYQEGRQASGDAFLFAQQMALLYRILLKKENAVEESVKWMMKEENAWGQALEFIDGLELTAQERDKAIEKILSYRQKFPLASSLHKAASILALKNNDVQKAYSVSLSGTGNPQESCLFLFSFLQNFPKDSMADAGVRHAGTLQLLTTCESVPSYGNMALNFSVKLLNDGKFSEAKEFLKHAVTKAVKENERSSLRLMLAESYEESGFVPEARKMYESILAQDRFPFSPKVYALYGNLLLNQGEYRDALSYFEKAGAAGFMTQDALLFYRGECAYLQEKPDESRSQFENLISLYPQSEYINDALFRLNVLKNGETENVKLLVDIERAQKAQKYDESESMLLLFISQKHGSALLRAAHLLLGENYELKKDFKSAIDVYQKMLASFEEGAWTDDVQEKIKKLMKLGKG